MISSPSICNLIMSISGDKYSLFLSICHSPLNDQMISIECFRVVIQCGVVFVIVINEIYIVQWTICESTKTRKRYLIGLIQVVCCDT